MNAYDDLDAYLDEHDGWTPNVDEPSPEIAPDDVVRAERALARLARLRKEQADVKAAAADRIAIIEARRDDLVAGIDKAAAWIEQSLEGWHRARVAAGMTSGKTLSLPGGKLRLRAPGSPKLVATEDEHTVAEGLQQTRPLWVREKLSLDRQVIKDATVVGPNGEVVDASTGEIVDGLAYEVDTEDRFSIEVAK